MKTKPLSQSFSVLEAIQAGGRVVHPKYLSEVLALAAQEKLTAEEMERLVFPDGRPIFGQK